MYACVCVCIFYLIDFLSPDETFWSRDILINLLANSDLGGIGLSLIVAATSSTEVIRFSFNALSILQRKKENKN